MILLNSSSHNIIHYNTIFFQPQFHHLSLKLLGIELHIFSIYFLSQSYDPDRGFDRLIRLTQIYISFF